MLSVSYPTKRQIHCNLLHVATRFDNGFCGFGTLRQLLGLIWGKFVVEKIIIVSFTVHF